VLQKGRAYYSPYAIKKMNMHSIYDIIYKKLQKQGRTSYRNETNKGANDNRSICGNKGASGGDADEGAVHSSMALKLISPLCRSVMNRRVNRITTPPAPTVRVVLTAERAMTEMVSELV